MSKAFTKTLTPEQQAKSQEKWCITITGPEGDRSLTLQRGKVRIYLDGRPKADDAYGEFRFSAASIKRLLAILNGGEV